MRAETEIAIDYSDIKDSWEDYVSSLGSFLEGANH